MMEAILVSVFPQLKVTVLLSDCTLSANQSSSPLGVLMAFQRSVFDVAFNEYCK